MTASCLNESKMNVMLFSATVLSSVMISLSMSAQNDGSKIQLERHPANLIKRRNSPTEPRISWVEKVNRSKVELPNGLGKDLRFIGLFLAAHKYFESDRRYAFSGEEKDDKSKFYKHFPIPRLRNRHPQIVSACDQGFLPCVSEISNTAKNSGSLAKIHNKWGNKSIQYASYYPFKDTLELFQYRVSASYYMCWYTDLREKNLALIDEMDCFKDLKLTEEANGKTIVDFRSKITIAGNKYSIFTCAYLWFCPDPCYGKSTNGNVKNFNEAKLDRLNPCGSLLNKDCVWQIGHNKDFDDLIRNKFNYTCDCELEEPGYVWSPAFSICVDRDECYEKVDDCPEGKICRNTVHSFDCTCRRGYHFDKESDKCERNELLSPAAASALAKNKKKRDQMKEKKKGVLYILKLLVDIAKGSSSQLNYSKLVLVSTLFCSIVVLLK